MLKRHRLVQFFGYSHLPLNMQAVSKQFHELAIAMADALPENCEKTTCLRRLLEAKDCAVRALIYRENP
jgi:ferritin-like protein